MQLQQDSSDRADDTSTSLICTNAVPLLPKRVASGAVQLLAKARGRVSLDKTKPTPAATGNPFMVVGGKPLLGRDGGPKTRTRDMEQRILMDVLRRAAGQKGTVRTARKPPTADDSATVSAQVADGEASAAIKASVGFSD